MFSYRRFISIIILQMLSNHLVLAFPNFNENNYNNNSISIYGPLKLDFSQLTLKQNLHIIPALNSNDQKLYLAISCLKNKINVAYDNLIWIGWQPPKFKYEIELIEDICSSYSIKPQ